jgi:3-oxoacyl-[acyl-carrier protein] reductase
MKLDNAVCIVTGGGTGTGAACAVQLARKGCRVVVNYSRSEKDALAVVRHRPRSTNGDASTR